MKRISYNELCAFVRGVLDAAGLDEYSAQAVSNGLCETSLRGVDSHGVRLLPHYVRSAQTGRKNARPKFRFARTFPSMGCLDADNAFGHAAGMKAIEHGMEMAAETGVGMVGVRNSSHPGAMASFAMKAARAGYMALAFTHADSLLLSHGGTRPYFGTNPVCFAAPRSEGEPYCLDMATSVIPWNRLLLHKGEPLPENVGADAKGNATTDPTEAVCLMPTGGYKGTGLASMVEVFCAIFTGMTFGRDIPAMYKAPMDAPRKLGQCYIVMRCDGCVDAATFASSLTRMTEAVRAEPSRPEQDVMLAGDKEMHAARRRRETGVPLDPETLAEFGKLANEFNIPMELP